MSAPLVSSLLTLAIVRPAKADAPCPDCDGWGYHYTERTMADPAGQVDCKPCRGEGVVSVRACMGCLDAPATEGVLCEVCSGAVDAPASRGPFNETIGQVFA